MNLRRWEKIRKIGKWNFILIITLVFVLGSTTLTFLIDYIFDGTVEVSNFYFKTVGKTITGFALGIFNWYYAEAKYRENLSENSNKN